MSRHDSCAEDPTSYCDRRSDVGYSDGGLSSHGRSYKYFSVKEADGVADLDGLVPFEKNFYKESSAVASMTEAEVKEYCHKREITVKGRDVPRPVKDFQDAGFPDYVMQEIVKVGFVEPTPIQSQEWQVLIFTVLSALMAEKSGVKGRPVEDLAVELPGQPKVDFRQFARYVDVDDEAGKSLFYYFAEAEKEANIPAK